MGRLPMVVAAGLIDSSDDGSNIKLHYYTQRQRTVDAIARRRAAEFSSSSADASSAAPSPSPLSSSSPLPSKKKILQKSTPPRIFHVTEYGADPTGKADSTAAIGEAIADACAAATSQWLIAGVNNLGGAEVHLDGGLYLIDAPITLPVGSGNVKIHGGSLRASDEFPTDHYLIELSASQNATSQTNTTVVGDLTASSGYNFEYVTLRGLMLDANYRGGGITVVDALRTVIDDCYIVHFASEGVAVHSGHETLIRASFIGQHITAGADPGEKNFSGTGINLAGNDNIVTDVVIFSASVGVLVSGQANILTGVHCYNKATGFGGTGIYLKLPGLTQTRITNCYLDYASIVAEDPVQLLISGSFFLGDANVVLKSVNGVAKGVDIVDNMFAGGGRGVDIVTLDGNFTSVDQVNVDRNTAKGMTVRATAAQAAVAGNGTKWTVDFSTVLLFPDRIGHVQYSMQSDTAFFRHALRNVSGNTVVIESDVAIQATVYVEVNQAPANGVIGV
ncbi:polygalacturonase QRT3-like isoform X2 [Curcuma longa]|uniref:polygalacturonase QRT3-like isoform X2 n=1 Tax=Curcuma longa TaxID=136217 RepID=UPI003D9DD4E7